MGSELEAAAERLRRVETGESLRTIYCGDFHPVGLSRVDLRDLDRGIVASAYLAELSTEPLTADYLLARGGEWNEQKTGLVIVVGGHRIRLVRILERMHVNASTGEITYSGPCWSLESDDHKFMDPTIGQFLTLCRLLGVEVPEPGETREPQPAVPDNWHLHHHPDCGTLYRGCHPTLCPKDQYEQTGVWKPELAKQR